MTATTIRVQMAQRKDPAANWTAANPILLSGEIGYETDTKKFKIGNGSTNWNSLAYLPIPDGSGNLTITGNLEIGSTGSLTFEGSTADGFETTLAVTNPTADRTITLPNQSGTVLVSGNASIVDADIAASAEIAVSKLADGTARQLLQTDAAGTGVEWTSNVDIPGTLDVTGAATFDAAVTVAGDLTVNGTTTTISTQNLLVEDKNIIIGDVATPTDVTADGGGITLKGATDKTINWVDATDAWTSSERFSVPLGTAALPSLMFTGDTNTGIYSPGADQVAISTGGSGRLFVDASGNVGVGTASPTSLLHLSTSALADLRFTDLGEATDQKNWSWQTGTGIGAGTFRLRAINDANSTGENAYIVTRSGASVQTHQWLTAGSERLRITSAGNVGIGTTSPSSKLSIVTSANSPAFDITDASTSDFIITPGVSSGVCRVGPATGAMSLYTANTERARIDSSGRLLVGTSSDSGGALLQVNGDRVRVATAKTPASASDTGTTGEICWDANYIYVCTATNTWKRSAISTW
jgi:hypothetical protein